VAVQAADQLLQRHLLLQQLKELKKLQLQNLREVLTLLPATAETEIRNNGKE
jgi:hypothetical protein